ncbi:MAG TPA: YqgE/AlgH family protein [Thermoleophilaceae bacterium]|nr:YqgE/AlgH family protein [Thermoleophilaceae bacterium]
MDESLRGKLLIASPQLADYFRRTVVLIVEHSEDGAMGIVLNRRTDAEVKEVVPTLAPMTDDDDVIHAGGPVEPDTVIALGDFEDPDEAGAHVTGSIGVLDPDRPEPALRRLRVFAGYAGWAPGQLDAEMEQDAWIVTPARPEDAFAPDDLWRDVVQRKGGKFALMATMPIDPRMN